MNAKTLYKIGFTIILAPIILAAISLLGFSGSFFVGGFILFLGILVSLIEDQPDDRPDDRPEFTTCPNCGARERATSTTCRVCEEPF